MRKRLLLVIAIAVGIFAVLSAIVVRNPQKPLLMHRATPVMKTYDWIASPYFWLSDESIVGLRKSSVQPLFHLVRYNLQTGAETAYDTFNSTFSGALKTLTLHTNGGENVHYVNFCDLSPDGQWFLWTPTLVVTAEQPSFRMVGNVHNESCFQWRPSSEYLGEFAWLPDSKHWVELLPMNPNLTVYGLSSQDRRRTVTIQGQIAGDLLGVTPEGNIVTAAYDNTRRTNSAQIHLFEAPLNRTPAPLTESTLQLSAPAYVTAMTMSADGKHLAWLARFRKIPNFIERVQNRFQVFGHPDELGPWELWVSRLDGKEMHLIGAVPIDPAQEAIGSDRYVPQTLRWLPDGKRLSFIYNQALYTVPAN